jgi:hypothetical protein
MGTSIGFRVCLLCNRPGRLQSADRIHQLLVKTSLESFQATLLGIGQILRKRECPQVSQKLPESFDPSFQLCGSRRQDGRRIRLQDAARVAQDLAPIHLIRNPVGRDEDHGVRGA